MIDPSCVVITIPMREYNVNIFKNIEFRNQQYLARPYEIEVYLKLLQGRFAPC